LRNIVPEKLSHVPTLLSPPSLKSTSFKNLPLL